MAKWTIQMNTYFKGNIPIALVQSPCSISKLNRGWDYISNSKWKLALYYRSAPQTSDNPVCKQNGITLIYQRYRKADDISSNKVKRKFTEANAYKVSYTKRQFHNNSTTKVNTSSSITQLLNLTHFKYKIIATYWMRSVQGILIIQ